jgi:hypothetical protein
VRVCAGIKRSGGLCTVSVGREKVYCHHHDPIRAEQRRKAASRAGKSKPSKELLSIKAQLETLIEDMLSGELATGVGAVVNQLVNTRLRAIELERKVKETERLEERIEILERAAGQRPGGENRSWR